MSVVYGLDAVLASTGFATKNNKSHYNENEKKTNEQNSLI